jgi:hypothetical protein
MKCPHCNTSFHDVPQLDPIDQDSKGNWAIEKLLCPEPDCGQMTLFLLEGDFGHDPQGGWYLVELRSKRMVYPKGSNRPPVPPAIPKEFAEDYIESCLVLADSPKASAALSRRCLQHILREKAGIKRGDLATEIQQVIDSRTLPSHLNESIDAIRNIGNFASD